MNCLWSLVTGLIKIDLLPSISNQQNFGTDVCNDADSESES